MRPDIGKGRSANQFFGIDFSHVRHVGRRRSSQCFGSVFITRVQHFSHLLDRIKTTCGFDMVTTKNSTCCVCLRKYFQILRCKMDRRVTHAARAAWRPAAVITGLRPGLGEIVVRPEEARSFCGDALLRFCTG